MLFSRSADSFLMSHGIHPEQVDMDLLCRRFLHEMHEGLRGDPSSLAMLPTFVSVKDTIPSGEPVIVLDAGGTNFRSCLVTFDDEGKSYISSYSKQPMPGSKGLLSKDEFFHELASYTLPLIKESATVGFCFSYPTESTPGRDGRVLHFSKEVQAPDVVGELVGENLKHLFLQHQPEGRWTITILNDTAATLLAGKIAARKHYSGYIGFILGTGTNTSYVESCEAIGKIDRLSFSGANQIVNVESGGFFLGLSDLDRQFYDTTKHPESYHFEKVVSGAYLGPYVLFVLHQAAREGLFCEETCRSILEIKTMSTIEMDDLLHTPDVPSVLHHACGENLMDRSLVYQIADRLIERAARLSAVNLSAAVLKSGAGGDPSRPVCINADGTTFLKTHHLKKYTEEYLREYLVEQHGRFYEMIHVDNAPVLGAAIAGLQNR